MAVSTTPQRNVRSQREIFSQPTLHYESMDAKAGKLFDLRFAILCTAVHKRMIQSLVSSLVPLQPSVDSTQHIA